MKHLIITAIVSLGLVAQSGMVSIDQQMNTGQPMVAIGPSPSGSQQLSGQEMSAAVGGENLTGCWGYIDALGDKHGICCVDLWLFKICVDVNASELERLLQAL